MGCPGRSAPDKNQSAGRTSLGYDPEKPVTPGLKTLNATKVVKCGRERCSNTSAKTKWYEAHMVGREATKQMRAVLSQDKKGRGMLIVGCTGYERDAHRKVALAAGQDCVLGKPYEEAAIKQVILDWWLTAPR